jgi:hypothetical protein
MAHVNDEANCAAIVLTTLTAFWSSAASPAPSSTSAQAAQPRVADCNSNGIADDLDIAAGTSSDCDGNTEPDECATGARPGVDCDDDGWSDACALAVNAADDCNSNGIPDKCELSAGTADDCDLSGTLDECEIGGAKQVAKLVASDGQSFDYFGHAVALDGDALVIGAPLKDIQAPSSGAAYVFERSAGRWQQTARLVLSNPSNYAYFGWSVAVEGETIVIGARGGDGIVPDSGAAFVFQRTGGIWSEIAKLSADDGVGGDYFGESLAISGSTVVVGASRDDGAGTDSGSVYLFREVNGTWQQIAKLTPNDGERGDAFGRSVAIDSNRVLVGTPYDDDLGVDSGACYLFQEQGGQWHQVVKLTAGDDFPWTDQFGASLAIEGDSIVVGSPYHDFYGSSSGAVFVFRKQDDDWVQDVLLRSAAARPQSYFGRSLDIYQGQVVVGETWGNLAGPRSGTAILFQESDSGWRQVGAFADRDPADSDYFGYSVAIGASTVVSGARFDDELGWKSGSASIFEILAGQPDCNGNRVLDGCELTSDPSRDCNGNGYLDVCEMHAEDCNVNRIPDECEADCNGNGIPNDCEIEAGTAEDCNANGVSDDCELAAGTAFDCNHNGVLDTCNLERHVSVDCNRNSVPDSCEIADNEALDCNRNAVLDSCELTGQAPINIESPSVLRGDAQVDVARDRDVQMAADGMGRVIAIWRSEDSLDGTVGDDYDLMVARSSDEGQTWSNPAPLNEYALTDFDDDHGPRIATDGSGVWIVAWQTRDEIGGAAGDDLDIVMTRSEDHGATWSPVTALNIDAAADHPRSDEDVFLAAQSDGVWIAVWTSSEILGTGMGTRYNVLYSRSTDHGATWSPPAAVADASGWTHSFGSKPYIVADGLGHWIAAWWAWDEAINDPAVWIAYSSDNGGSWSITRPQEAAWSEPRAFIAGEVALATDGLGTWICVFMRQGQIYTVYPPELYYSFSQDNGASWTPPMEIAVDQNLDTDAIGYFNISANKNSDWMIVWAVNAYSSAAQRSYDEWMFIESRNGGTDWTLPRFAYPGEAYPDTRRLAPFMSPTGHRDWLVAWEGVNELGGATGDDEDILFARISIPEPAADCNRNATPDECEIAAGSAADCNANFVLDACELMMKGDHDGDFDVDVADLVAWEACLSGPCAGGDCGAADLHFAFAGEREFRHGSRAVVRGTAGIHDVSGVHDAAELGGGEGLSDCCALMDFDDDFDVDLVDYAALQAAFTGSGGLDCYGNSLADQLANPHPDLDGDLDVDLVDFAIWQGCATRPCGFTPCQPPRYTDPCCTLADFDRDGDVDLADVARMMAAFD